MSFHLNHSLNSLWKCVHMENYLIFIRAVRICLVFFPSTENSATKATVFPYLVMFLLKVHVTFYHMYSLHRFIFYCILSLRTYFFFATITIIDNLITTYDSNNRFRDKFNEYQWSEKGFSLNNGVEEYLARNNFLYSKQNRQTSQLLFNINQNGCFDVMRVTTKYKSGSKIDGTAFLCKFLQRNIIDMFVARVLL